MGQVNASQILPAIHSHPMSLDTKMRAFKLAFEAGAPPSVLGAVERAEMALRQSDILEQALKAGEPGSSDQLRGMEKRF